jgi:pseudouridylate synthase
VAAALRDGQPVVALESTVIAHGLPRPRNLEVARQVQEVIVAAGAVPATIAVFDGRLQIGLSDEQTERLATSPGIRKLSNRDLSIALALKQDGATTVATTMLAAAIAGIRVFTTGGIGGVHRGAESSFDESADLSALAQCPVAVVSAGAKSILDLPKTLERLETLGVPVIGYRTASFPAFFMAESGLPVDERVDDLAALARILGTRWALGQGGAVIANPVPAYAAIDPALHDKALAKALAKVEAAGISGKDTTPALLAAMRAETGEAMLEANIALLLNNAKLAAELAIALCR